MARQIQIRRGSEAEHENFTGAIGEITMDTTDNTLRVHDGTTVGGVTLAKREDIPSDIMNADYVIEYQAPTAENGYTWYRKYKSGWVEQGGTWDNWNPVNASDGKSSTKNLAIKMSDTQYLATISLNSIGPSYAGLSVAITRKVSSVELYVWNFQTTGNYTSTGYITWFVSGMSAA